MANPTGNLWVNRTKAAGLNIPVSCVSAAAADFDNDMDTDIYLVCRNAVSNAQDILYENTGGGIFTAVSGAGGAPGPLGIGVGTGDSVVTADFDVDGFVNLFQTNGLALFPETPFSTGGPDKLYRNAGIANGSNHWVELDFAGTTSNRDGIGAIVTVTAGGKAQRQERNGGVHRWSQNHQRLHFGLASNATADIEVQWPSGALTTYSNVPADHLYRVSEDGSITQLAVGQPALSPCGPPTYNKATDRALFIWKNCATDTWQVRVTPGGGSWVVYKGDVQSDQNFTSLTGFSIEANDTLNVSDPSKIVYSLRGRRHQRRRLRLQVPGRRCGLFRSPGPDRLAGISRAFRRRPMSVPFDLGSLSEPVTSDVARLAADAISSHSRGTSPGMGIRASDNAMKFLYIVSSPHGGSTLLSLVLGMHPRAANLGEVSLIPKQLAMVEPCTCGEPLAACPAWQPFFELLARRENVDLRTSPYGFFLGHALKSRIGSGLIDTAYQTKRRVAIAKLRGAADTLALLGAPHRALLRLLTLPSIRASVDNTIKLYEIAAEAWGRQLMVDTSKLPKKAVHLYLRDPARVRILHLLRDGRGVLASSMKYMSTEYATGRWIHYQKLAQPLLRHCSRGGAQAGTALRGISHGPGAARAAVMRLARDRIRARDAGRWRRTDISFGRRQSCALQPVARHWTAGRALALGAERRAAGEVRADGRSLEPGAWIRIACPKRALPRSIAHG